MHFALLYRFDIVLISNGILNKLLVTFQIFAMCLLPMRELAYRNRKVG